MVLVFIVHGWHQGHGTAPKEEQFMCVNVGVSSRIRYTPPERKLFPKPGTTLLLALVAIVACCCSGLWDAFECLSVRPRLEDDSG